jgi:nucleotide-binding universal stress UspA family protein
MNVLIGVDDSTESRHAIDIAFNFFGPDADYTVISVGENRPLFTTGYPGGTFVSAVHLTARFDNARQAALEQAQQAADSLPVDADVAANVGQPGTSLCDAASEFEADVVVIGSHDKNTWERLLHPSIGRYLIDHSPCPVLVVR